MNVKYLVKERLFSLSSLLAISIIGRILGGVGFLSTFFLALSMLLIVIALFNLIVSNKKSLKMDRQFMFFIFYLLFNIFVNDIAPVFNVYSRFSIFVLLLLICSSFLQSKSFRKFRYDCFFTIMWLLVAIGCISFICYFIGVNLFEDRNYSGYYLDDYQESAGHFSGITAHSMLLGPCAAIATCYTFSRYLVEKKRFFLVLTIMCIGSVAFAASRGAFYALIVSILAIIYYGTKSKIVFSMIIVALLGVVAFTYPLWSSAFYLLQQKQEDHSQLGVFDSRTDKIYNRVDEFMDSPVIGIGFQTVSLKSTDAPKETGNIEPGSSWLAVLSMVGLIGFLFILHIVWGSVMSVKKYCGNSTERCCLLGILVFFIVNMLVEGYIFAGGSCFCFILWLTLGVSRDYKYKERLL